MHLVPKTLIVRIMQLQRSLVRSMTTLIQNRCRLGGPDVSRTGFHCTGSMKRPCDVDVAGIAGDG
jgi:hypothetical protein